MKTMVRGKKYPDTVVIKYMNTDKGHVFKANNVDCNEICGSNMREGFDKIIALVSSTVESVHGVEVTYRPNMSFDDFKKELFPNGEKMSSFLTCSLA